MIATGILSTLRYCDHFNYPLTLAELHSRLIRQKITPPQLKTELTSLISSHQLGLTTGYYHLPGRASLVKTRLTRQTISAQKLEKLTHLVPGLAHIPGVLAIYLTGSLAMHNAIKSDDIDLLIITNNGRLWTTRLLLTLYTELRGLRRRPLAHQVSDQLCFNLYLTPQSFTLPLSKRLLYTAYELIQATPLYDPQDTHSRLLSSNSWLKTYLPNYIFPAPHSTSPFLPRRSGIVENFAYRLQTWYMRNRLTREHITRDSAFFHPQDPSPGVK